MNWEIFSYGGGDFLRMIFNGIASIFGNNDYWVALRITALLGLIGFLLSSAFQAGKLSMNWLLGMIMILMIAIVPKVDLIITDRVVAANSAVVSNVPLGLAATAAGFSKLEDWATRAFETVFSLPNQMTYSTTGLLFGSALVEESTRFEMTDARVSANFSDFWKSCVYYDLLLGKYTWNSLVKSTNLMGFFATNTSVARGFTYQKANGDREIQNCLDSVSGTGVLTTDLNNEIANSTNIQGARLVPDETNRTLAVAKFAAALPVSYQYLTGISMSANNIMSQNILANSLKRGLTSFSSDADASAAAQDFIQARAEAERKSTFTTMGKLAKKMLPITKNLFEAFIYAAFPIVMLMAMLPSAPKVLAAYIKALFWVNLWAPLYAVLHFAMTYFGQHAASASVIQSGAGFATGLSVMTNTGLGSTLNDYSAIAGYLSLSIPMIAWMFVSSSGAMMAGLAGRLMQSYDQPVSKASDQATTGNITQGNTTLDTHSFAQNNAAPTSVQGGMKVSDAAGNARAMGADGITTTQVATSAAGFDITSGSSVSNAAKSAVGKAESVESSTGAGLVQNNAAIRASSMQVAETADRSTSVDSTATQTDRAALSKAQQESKTALESYMVSRGVSVSNAKELAENVHAGVEAKIGANTPLGGVQASAGAGIQASNADRQTNAHDAKIAQDAQKSQQYTEAVRREGEVAQQLAAKLHTGEMDSTQHALNAQLQQQTQSSKSHSLAVKDVESANAQMEHVEQVSAQINASGNQAFTTWLTSADGKNLDRASMEQLLRDANNGNTEAMRHRAAYADEYVAERLSEYTQNTATREGFNNRYGEGTEDMRALDREGNQAVDRAVDGGNATVAKTDRANLDIAGQKDKAPSREDTQNEANTITNNVDTKVERMAAGSIASPDSTVIDRNAVELHDRAQGEMDKTFIDRAAESATEAGNSVQDMFNSNKDKQKSE